MDWFNLLGGACTGLVVGVVIIVIQVMAERRRNRAVSDYEKRKGHLHGYNPKDNG
jgi:hypothetical protein